jgi:hypothetical protein
VHAAAGLPAAEADSHWEKLMEEFHKAPFDMARPPLMRVLLAVLPGHQRHRLLFTMHHGEPLGIVNNSTPEPPVQHYCQTLYPRCTADTTPL